MSWLEQPGFFCYNLRDRGQVPVRVEPIAQKATHLVHQRGRQSPLFVVCLQTSTRENEANPKGNSCRGWDGNPQKSCFGRPGT